MSEVPQLHDREPRLLPGDEPEAGELLTEVFTAEGISVRTGVSAMRVSHGSGRFAVHLDDGGVLGGQRLLVATGRRTDLAALGVGAVGLDEQARTIAVDDRMRAADRVWAVGDVTGEDAFTHVSMYQARIAAADVLGRDGETADYRALPRVTFTDPEVTAVGLTKTIARDRGLSADPDDEPPRFTGQVEVEVQSRFGGSGAGTPNVRCQERRFPRGVDAVLGHIHLLLTLSFRWGPY